MSETEGSRTVQPIILAGGSGGGLWPLSRSAYPKQLLDLGGTQSLLQETVQRLGGLGQSDFNVLGPIMVCQERHRFLIDRQLSAIEPRVRAMVLEPQGRHTAPAATLACHVAGMATPSETGAPPEDPLLLLLPADHLVRSPTTWQAAVRRALSLATEGKIAALGVAPDRPESAYGYIRKGAQVGRGREGFAIEAFVEKPSVDTARSFMSAAKYVWNSGIFAVRASTWLAAIERGGRDIASAMQAAADGGAWDGHFFRPEPTAFNGSPSESIDYAVMEQLVRAHGSAAWHNHQGRPIGAAVVEMSAGWADVGTWPVLLQTQDQTASNGTPNVTLGNVISLDCERCVTVSTRRLVATVGLTDVIAVETPDAVLVAHRDRADEVAEVVEELRRAGRAEADVHRRAHRPWGISERLHVGDHHAVRHLVLYPGESMMLQMHERRTEHWMVIAGEAEVLTGEERRRLIRGDSASILPGTRHRISNAGAEALEVIEVQTGELDRSDVHRFDA